MSAPKKGPMGRGHHGPMAGIRATQKAIKIFITI